MPLTPSHRTLLGDALQPPPGFRVDIAVGTTYSMNLTALLTAPLSFASVSPDGFADAAGDELSTDPDFDPIQLLEAVRRYADRTTIFCQAGGIHVPTYRSLLTFIEDSVIEVTPPGGGIFHPKIWALRFVDTSGHYTHRLVVLSRNLTFDRSWDTALVLDEDESGSIDAEPAAAFLRGLPGLTVHSMDSDRHEQVNDLAATLEHVRLAPPAPFTKGELLSIGLNGAEVWPFPEHAKRVLAISPFLTQGAIAHLVPGCEEKTLVSRDETFTRLGRRTLRESGWVPHVLQQEAITGAEDPIETDSAQEDNEAFLSPPDGLHAKTFVVDIADGSSQVTTGSANLTGSPWGGSVEFDVRLLGPTAECGVEAVLGGSRGLHTVLEEFWPEEDEGPVDATEDAEKLLEKLHLQLVTGGEPTLVIEPTSDSGDVRIQLRIDTRALDIAGDQPITTRVWPSALPATQAREIPGDASWIAARDAITPFLAVQSSTTVDGAVVTRTCVIKAALEGDVADRQSEAMSKLLTDQATVMRYIAFLLGAPQYGPLGPELTGATGSVSLGRGQSEPTTLALFEPLVRAAGRDGETLSRIQRLVDDIRQMPDGHALIPDGFDDLWQVVWSVHEGSADADRP